MLCLLIVSFYAEAKKNQPDFYQIKIYSLKNNDQVNAVDVYLKNIYLPALHRAGVAKIGVFKPISNDTAVVKKIYVLLVFPSTNLWLKINAAVDKDEIYKSASKDFENAPYDHAPFERIESILLESFPAHPNIPMPVLKNSVSEKIYELRSYESPTMTLHAKKVKMFNEGGEIGLFKRLNFNAVFYAKVISGSRMPNLMYMISFENIVERNAHWTTFKNDAEWKKISTIPEYDGKVSVSHIDSILMHATDYSEF
jgi:hypothetical protein